jgi:hypothetical protein
MVSEAKSPWLHQSFNEWWMIFDSGEKQGHDSNGEFEAFPEGVAKVIGL